MSNSNQSQHRFIVSGGGTGGHIFPAIAIANALKEALPDADILFVGAKNKMEMEKVPEAGYPIEGLWISGLQRKLTLKNLSFPFKVISSLQKAGTIINRFKPDVVVGVGGYASGPLLRMAGRKGIPTVIQEQNSFPGITNKLLAKSVKRICVAYDGMEKFFPVEKIVKTGNPIRKEVIDIKDKREKAAGIFNLDKDKKTVFVVGGSQGAMSVNRSIQKNIDLFIKNDIQLIWQTGKLFAAEARKIVDEKKATCIRVVEFIKRMDLAYAMADVIISRAGAIAISEICAVSKPAVFIPLPSAAEDHQTKNAQALVDKEAALLVPDREAAEKLAPVVLDLINNDKKRQQLAENISKLAITDSAERIAKEIIQLIPKENNN